MAGSRTQLEELIELKEMLYAGLKACDPEKIAPLARQYRETLERIETLEGAEANDDDIAAILSERESAGKAGSVR